MPDIYVKSFIKTLFEFYQNLEDDQELLNQIKTKKNISQITAPTQNPNKTKTVQQSQVVDNSKNVNNKPYNTVETNNSNTVDRTNVNTGTVSGTVVPELKNVFDITKTEVTPDTKTKTVEPEIIIDVSDYETDSVSVKAENVKLKPKNKIKQHSTSTQIKLFKNTINLSSRDILIYLFLILFLAAVVFMVFFNNTATTETSNTLNETHKKVLSDSESTSKDVVEIKNDGLSSYFNSIDSIILTAKCQDSAWVKVEIDGKDVDEKLMKPGMESRWSAFEKIVLSTSNVGGVVFSKNDTILPKLGAVGSMVKNIVISRDGIANVSPLSAGNKSVSATELPSNQQKIVPSTPDTAKLQQKKNAIKKRKVDTAKPSPIIDFSTPPKTKPPILE
ncbi:hypothetical protein SDC9_122606 [bioreactor metagenome]|uniref:Cytoskeleton protein RodZ-like C-terminal domain-containing protein n=1 Tax=bioreactor metagenome TaxID=1076179 RepID=A0A645CFH6_9ZZZZ